MASQTEVPESYDDRLVWFATAPCVVVEADFFRVKGQIVKRFVGRVRGKLVALENEEFAKDTREEAEEIALKFRDDCKRSAIEKGLLQA